MSTDRKRPGGGPTGWAATALGGLVTGAAAGFLAWQAAVAFYEPRFLEELADGKPGTDADPLAAAVFYGGVAAVLGAGFGAWAAGRLLGYRRPEVSGVLFALLMIVLVPVVAGVGALLVPVNIGLAAGTVFVLVVSAALAGIFGRTVAERVARRDGA